MVLMIKKSFFLLLLTIFYLTISCSRYQESWVNFTNANNVSRLALEGNYIWAVSYGGVVRWNINTGEYIKYITADGLIDNDVRSIAIDSEGNKWFGTTEGVSKFYGTNWTTYTTSDGLAENRVNSIAIDLEGNKWFGTTEGVSKFDGTNWTNYTTSDGLAENWVVSIAIDSYGNKWFGTGGGVSFLGDPVTVQIE